LRVAGGAFLEKNSVLDFSAFGGEGDDMGLLAEDEPPPVRIENKAGGARFVLTADHAGNRMPRKLGSLGLDEAELGRHIAWDIGIAGVTSALAAQLDAVAVFQTYSRLVIDCNRRPEVASAFPAVSEATPIPGNLALSPTEKAVRREALFDPYHRDIAALLRSRRETRPVYVAMHSFTPVYLGVPRPMQVAVLYNRSPRLSKALACLLREEGDLVVAENEPYRVTDETDYGVPVHAEGNGLDYVEIEIRQDLIAAEAGQAAWAARLARLLPRALAKLED
jgi:predicted N-formylglutamate amidohydrolase